MFRSSAKLRAVGLAFSYSGFPLATRLSIPTPCGQSVGIGVWIAMEFPGASSTRRASPSDCGLRGGGVLPCGSGGWRLPSS